MRKRAFREYISTMVDCDHSTGENAKVRAPPTAPPKHSSPDTLSSSSLKDGVPSLSNETSASSPDTKSCALRHISIAVHPAANAPNTAEQRLVAQAGVGLQKSHEQKVQKG